MGYKLAFEDGDVVNVRFGDEVATGIYSGDDWLGRQAPDGRVWVVIDGDVVAVFPSEIEGFQQDDDTRLYLGSTRQGRNMRTEAELLRAMAKATTLGEQRVLAQELDEVRAAARRRFQESRDTDIANAVIRDTLTPVAVHERSTLDTDWMGEIATRAGEYDHAMRTEATLWFKRVDADVKADRDEFGEQAMGMARHLAGQYGEQAEAAYRSFLDTVSRLWKQADDSPGQVDVEQSGNAESEVTDYDTDADQEPFAGEDWGGEPGTGSEVGSGVHPEMPGAGEGDQAIAIPEDQTPAYAVHRRAALRRLAEDEGQTCETCGDAIAQTDGSWHHDNGEKHDHEASPGGSSESSESSRRVAESDTDCTNCGHEFWDHKSVGDPNSPGKVGACRFNDCDQYERPGVESRRRHPAGKGRGGQAAPTRGKQRTKTAAESFGLVDRSSGDYFVDTFAGGINVTTSEANAARLNRPTAESLLPSVQEHMGGQWEVIALARRKTAEEGPTRVWKCEQCGRTIERYRGMDDIQCECGAWYNSFGQRLRDDWQGNPSNYDEDISDLEGYEQQYASRKTARQFSVRDEYDDKGSLTLWSGAFASDYEGEAVPSGDGYHITLYTGDELDVATPLRNDKNYDSVDQKIQEAIWLYLGSRLGARKTAGGSGHYQCQSCGHEFYTGNDFKINCPMCGSIEVKDMNPYGMANWGSKQASVQIPARDLKVGDEFLGGASGAGTPISGQGTGTVSKVVSDWGTVYVWLGDSESAAADYIFNHGDPVYVADDPWFLDEEMRAEDYDARYGDGGF